MKRRWIWGFGTLGALGLLAGVIIVLLSNRSVTTAIARDLIQRVDKQLPAKITFGHLSVDPLRGRAAIDDLSITIPGKPQEKFLAARQVIVDLDLGALARRKIHVRKIHLVDPEATVIHRGDNHFNFEEALPKNDKPEQPDQDVTFMTVDAITVDGGHVTYLDAPRKLSAELPHIKADLKTDLPAKHASGAITLSKGWVELQGEKQPIDSFVGRFDLAGKDLKLDQLKLDLGATSLAARGRVGNLGADPSFALEGLLKTKLQQWAHLAKQPIHGDAQADFQLAGSAKQPRVAARVSGQGLGYKQLAIADASARVETSTDAVKVDQLLAHLWGGRITGSATVPTRKGARLVAAAKADGLDLAAAARQLEVKGLDGLGGVASAEVRAEGDRPDPLAVMAAGWVRADGHLPVNRRDLPLKVRSDFRWDAGTLAFTRLDATALGGHVTGQGRVQPLAKVPTYAVTAHVDRLALAEVERIAQTKLPVTGSVDGDVTVAGRDFKRPQLTGTGRVRSMGELKRLAGGNFVPIPYDGTADVAFAGESLVVTGANVRVLGGTAGAHGTIGYLAKPPRVALTVDAHDIDLGQVDRAYHLSKGRLAGRADARVVLNDQVLTVQSADARTLGGHILASGRVLLANKPPAYALAVDARGLDIGTASKTFQVGSVPVSGKASARLAVSGAGPVFRAAGPVQAQGLAKVPDDQAKGVSTPLPFKLAGTIDLNPRGVKLQPLDATLGASTFQARGRLSLDAASDLSVTGHVVDAPAIAAVFGVKHLTGGQATLTAHASGQPGNVRLDGRIQAQRTQLEQTFGFERAQVAFQGSLTHTMHLVGNADATALLVQGQPIKALTVPFTYDAPAAKLGAGALAVANMQATIGTGSLGGKASYNPGNGSYVADLRTQGLTLGDIEAIRIRRDAQIPLTTPFALAFAGRGTVRDPGGDAQLSLDPFKLGDQAFGASLMRAHLAGRAVVLEGDIFAKQVVVGGRMPLDAAGNGQVVLAFNDVRLAPFFSLVPASMAEEVEVPVDGRLAGKVTIAGAMARPGGLTADVDLTRLRVAYRDLMLENQGPIQLHYGASLLVIKALHVKGQGTDLSAHGTVGLGAPSDFGVNGSINLALLEKLSPKNFADAGGKALIEASLKGTLGQPDLTGAVSIQNGELQTRSLPQAIRDLRANVRIVRDRVFLDNLRATLGYTGQISASGGAMLGKDFMPTSATLQMTGREVAVSIPDGSVTMNADLAFSGTPDASRLDGQVRVLEGKYTKDIPLTGGLGGRAGARSSGPDLSKIPFVKGMELAVQVSAPDQVTVKNNLADMELKADLAILGTPARPTVLGRAEAIAGGKISFQDRIYVVQEGTVDFIDRNVIKPYIHLVATTSVQGIDVDLAANGTPEQLKLDLKSTPYLPQSDVLTLLATGQTPAQLAQGTGSGSGAALSNLLVTQVAKGVERGVSDQGAVDVLRIQPGSAQNATDSTGSLTVGKRINDKLMITYTQDLSAAPGKTPGRLVIFDYTLTDALVLKMQQDLSGQGFNASARYRIPVR
ncbi:MAG: hypothetical protein JWM80_4014 [Cyanobacteria bacterium RYN_339]|nr:hypothetical protein [Cyanobacteria bacterium RYN_339]